MKRGSLLIARLGRALRATCAALFLAVAISAQGTTLTLESGADARGFATFGQLCRVRCSDPNADKLQVTYRPNSKTELSSEIAAREPGLFEWTPSAPGLVALAAFGPGAEKAVATKNFSVRFAETSLVGIVVMLFAALLLFGGAGISIRALLREDS